MNRTIVFREGKVYSLFYCVSKINRKEILFPCDWNANGEVDNMKKLKLKLRVLFRKTIRGNSQPTFVASKSYATKPQAIDEEANT